MTEQVVFKKACGSDEPLVDVVFVHGLTGDATETWQCPADGVFWPEWLPLEFKHLAIYTLGYPASMFEKWAKKEMDMFEVAGNVLERFAGLGIGTRPMVFVTHSLGGILTKILLRQSIDSEDEDCKAISESARLVVFLATPHLGASLASVLEALPLSSKHIALLANETGFLENLNDQYRAYANGKSDLKTAVYYEKHRTKKAVMVVSRESADPGVGGAKPVAVETDHIGICKPQDKDDIVYRAVRRLVGKVYAGVVSSTPGAKDAFGVDDYTNKFHADRRDLLDKLVDAGRAHEYDYANSAQNGFARQFVKTGLFTTARDDHDALLSEVETRFVAHVYHPLICKDGTDAEIRFALQTQVVDVLTEKQIGSRKFSPKAIVSALYYLTEQCHIRWDAPA